MNSWRTTLTGIRAIVVGTIPVIVALVNGDSPDWEAFGAAITAALIGLGLIGARGNAVTHRSEVMNTMKRDSEKLMHWYQRQMMEAVG